MGREVRRVPADWCHPVSNVNGRIRYVPLFDGYEEAVREWDEGADQWARGIFPSYATEESRKGTYSEWEGDRPDKERYMPVWPEEERTHYMMYETTSEGTPISPAFATSEELARWLFDNDVSAFADQPASYEGWLRVANGGYAPGAVFSQQNGMVTGVDALK